MDLIGRLHETLAPSYALSIEAANEIKSLAAENIRLRSGLKIIRDACDHYLEGAGESEFSNYNWLIGVANEALNK